MSEHDWSQDNLALYGIKGLTEDDHARLDRHAAECSACAQELARWRLFDQAIDRLCAPVHFAAGWEDRVLARWHKTQKPPRRLSAVARWAFAAAAMIMVAVVGGAVMTVAEQGLLAFPGGDAVQAEGTSILPGFLLESVRSQSSNNLKQIGLAVHPADNFIMHHVGEELRKEAMPEALEELRAGRDFGLDKDKDAKHQIEITLNASDLSEREVSKAALTRVRVLKELAQRNESVVTLDDSQSLTPPVAGVRPLTATVNGRTPEGLPELAVRMKGLQKLESDSKALAGQFAPFGNVTRNLGVNGTMKSPDGGSVALGGLDPNSQGLSFGLELNYDGTKARGGDSKGEKAAEAVDQLGRLGVIVQNAESLRVESALKRIDDLKDLAGKDDKAAKWFDANSDRFETAWGRMPMKPGAPAGVPNLPSLPEKAPAKVGQIFLADKDKAEHKPGGKQEQDKRAGGLVAGTPPPPVAGGGAQMRAGFGKGRAGESEVTFSPPPDAGASVPGSIVAGIAPAGKKTSELKLGKVAGATEYFAATGLQLPSAPADPKPGEKKAETAAQKSKEERKEGPKAEPSNLPAAATPEAAQPIAVVQPKPDPQVAQRKIIRTGEMEFEVDGFDNAVFEITKLINNIPGAFVATVNSDRLPNGKVKGAVVVRVPPEHLDKFVLDLRRDFAKTAELKSSRIGSADVTKQYTDVESRLRAARAMEERFISIIKTGKGEIKDLIVAERELGIWRTKIEEMEGEIRYYNNQVGLSTLTITAYEKEIRTAASMVVTEHVNMKIEADDVEKSLQAALTAVGEAKGRVTKSDLKQHAAGQLEAILQFEVSPAAAATVKEKLKTLGIVTHHDSQRLQQAEGGAAPTGDPIKSRTNDVRFTVNLYNTANIKPRETYEIQIAVQDVPGEYGKLLEAVTAAKGQVRVSQLDEKDKLNVYAQLDFDVPAGTRGVFDKQLPAVGDVVSRVTQRAGPGETATDRKVGYRILLKSVTSIQARETQQLQIAVGDVPSEYLKLLDSITQAKGQVRISQLNEQDKANIFAQIEFDVPTADRAPVDKQLADLGETVSRSTQRAGPSDVATGRKVTYRLTLKSVTSIQPRESFTLQAVSLDVAETFKKLQDAVAKAKGHVRTEQLNESDKQNINAQFDFDVPTSERGGVDKLLDEIADVYSRTTSRIQPTEIATDKKVGYRLTLLSRVAPREKVALSLEVTDVEKTAASLAELVKAAKGKVTVSHVEQHANGAATAIQFFDVPLGEKDSLVRKFRTIGKVRAQKQSQNLQAPEGRLAVANIDVTLVNADPIVRADEGLWPQIRTSLSYSFRLLSVSMMFVIVGICVLLPWALALWAGMKLVRRWRAKPQTAA